MDENELRIALENEDVKFEDDEEDLNGNEEGIFASCLEDFSTKEGTGRLVSNYKVFLRVLDDPSKVNHSTIVSALKALAEGISSARDELVAADGDVTKLSRDQWKAARASSMAVLFLFYKAVTEIESKYFAEQQNLSVMAAVQGKKRGKKAGGGSDSTYAFWEDHRYRLVSQVGRLLDCELEKVWPPGTAFYRGVTLAVCMVVSNPSARLSREIHLADAVFQVLGLLCSKYDELSAITHRLVQNVKISEDVAKSIAYGLNIFVEKYEMEKAVFEVAKETLKMAASLLERETVAERAVATFLHEVSQLNPKATITALPFVVQFLESESSTIRSAVLSVISELLSWSKNPLDENKDDENDQESLDDIANMREDILHHLLEHTRDTNALVRNKALQLATKLVQQDNLHLPEIVRCAEHARRRLMDKGVTVRKSAINLLSAAVYSDPVVIKFSTAEFKKQIRGLRQELIKLGSADLPMPRKLVQVIADFIELLQNDDLLDISLPETIKSPEDALKHLETLLKNGKYYEACEFFYLAISEFIQHPDFKPFEKEMKSKKMYVSFFKKCLNIEVTDSDDEDTNGPAIEDGGAAESDTCKAKRQYLTYIENCAALATTMELALPNFNTLLEMGTVGDKSEVIECFAVLTESGYLLDTAVTIRIIEAIAQMDAGCRSELIEFIYRIFLKGCDTAVSLVRRLFDILSSLSESQREHMGVIVTEMVKNGTLTNEHFQILWDAFGLTNPTWKSTDSQLAAFILSTIGTEKSGLITTNIDYLMDTGLGTRGLEDYHLARYTCEALMLLCPKQSKNVDEAQTNIPSIMFKSDHNLYEKLRALVMYGLSEKGNASTDQAFKKVVELVLQLIYRTCMEPKVIVLDLLQNIHKIVFGSGENCSKIKSSERIICRYLNFVTALLGAHVFYYENVVLTEVKRRKKMQEAKVGRKTQSRKNLRGANSTMGSAINGNLSVRSGSRSVNVTNASTASASNTSENEMDVIIGNIGYDAELETVRNYLERILNEPGAFRQMRTHTLYVCSQLSKWKSLQLKLACVHALCKIMSISSMSVYKSVDVFVALWTMAKESEVKCELIRAAILLNVRYPNQMEKCNASLLNGLQSSADCIKIATLDFVTFLALNDLVKIREHMTEVAVCLIDANDDVRDQAKDFMEQCEEKDNMLCNALPDILSKLSSKEDICQDKFQAIMKFLLERVKKDRMLLGFIEKLILRFKVASKGRQCEDLAFCLNQLNFNDKAFKIIKENLNAYQDKLGDQFVYDAFVNIITNLRKNAKPDLKLKLDEFEKDIVVARAKCLEKDRMEEAATRKQTANARVESSDSEVENEEADGAGQPISAGTSDEDRSEENGANDNVDDGSHAEQDRIRNISLASASTRSRRQPIIAEAEENKENVSESDSESEDEDTVIEANQATESDTSPSEDEMDTAPPPKATQRGVRQHNSKVAVKVEKPATKEAKSTRKAPQQKKTAQAKKNAPKRVNKKREPTPDSPPPGGDAAFSDSD